MRKFACWSWCVVFLIVATSASAATVMQGPPPPPGPPPQGPPPPGRPPLPAMVRIFLDCNACDSEFLRTEVTFVDYMRDRKDADVHVLVTTQGTGGGGTEWIVKFIGLGRFQGQDRTITFTTPQTATSDDRRKEVARILKIGLVSYAVDTDALPRLNVSYRAIVDNTVPARKKDPWNYWVFRLSANGNLNGESSSSSKSYNFNGSASRTTEAWKVSVSGNRRENRSEYDLTGNGDVYKSRSSSWSASGLVVRSAGPRLSFGLRSSSSGSTYSNQDLTLSLMPGVEFNVFPYKESTRRSLTLTYSIGATHNDYVDLTIYDKKKETVVQHAAGASLGLRQPWGSVYASASWSQQVAHPDFNRLGLSASTDVRLFKGFSFNIFGDYSRIRDQIALRKGSASSEEVLLRLRQLKSSYSYYVGFGFSYSFGSIFNSVVNPRYGGSGGGGVIYIY